jgi:hypothetical protein
MSGLLRYDDFEPGRVLGEAIETVVPEMARSWQAIFGAADAGGPAEGASLALVLMMRAYCRAVAPRPPGNVHARQRFALAATPRSGETVRTVVRCVGKEIKRERRYVELETAGTGEAGRALFTGKMTLVWAL